MKRAKEYLLSGHIFGMYLEEAYSRGRHDEREHCKAIAAAVRKELDNA